MRLSPAAFNGLLGDMGQDVLWRRAYACPCRDDDSGAATQGCPVCQAKGVFWDAVPTAAWTGLAGMKVVREWAAHGLWESGDVVFTIPGDSPLFSASEYDRVVMSNSSEAFTAGRRRGAADDRVLFPVLQIDRAFWITGDAIVDGGIPAVTADGAIDWTAADPAPADGVQYTIKGRKHQEYFLFKDLIQDRAHFHGFDLPRKVVARRFDLFGR